MAMQTKHARHHVAGIRGFVSFVRTTWLFAALMSREIFSCLVVRGYVRAES